MVLVDPFAVVLYLCAAFVVGVLVGYRLDRVVRSLKRRIDAWDRRHGLDAPADETTDDLHPSWAEERHTTRTLRPVEDNHERPNVRTSR